MMSRHSKQNNQLRQTAVGLQSGCMAGTTTLLSSEKALLTAQHCIHKICGWLLMSWGPPGFDRDNSLAAACVQAFCTLTHRIPHIELPTWHFPGDEYALKHVYLLNF